MISLDFLEEIDVFKELDDPQLTAVQGCCEECEFQRGDKIFGAGEDSQYFWVVRKGQVNLIWDLPDSPAVADNALTTLSAGMAFGWSSLVPPHKYRLSAVCASRNCTVIRIKNDRFGQLFADDAGIGYKVMAKVLAVVGTRFHQLQDEVAKRRGQDIINRW